MKSKPLMLTLLLIFSLVFIWSLILPRDVLTWFLESFLVLIAVPLLIFTYRRFRFTDMVYILICIHTVILLIGAHYTYAENPLFNWIRDFFHLARNHYDRVGHFAQGFIPAMVARELLLRTSPLKRGGWLFFIVACICLAISAFYELIEWWSAVILEVSAESFLGTQGDVWDSQSDMFMCLIGAVAALLTLSRLHDRFLKKEGWD